MRKVVIDMAHKNVNVIYKLIGYYSDANHPNIVNDFLIEQVNNGGTFRASVLEAQKLYQDGLLSVDTSDTPTELFQ